MILFFTTSTIGLHHSTLKSVHIDRKKDLECFGVHAKCNPTVDVTKNDQLLLDTARNRYLQMILCLTAGKVGCPDI